IRQVSSDDDPGEDSENGERDDAGGDHRDRLIEGNGGPGELTENRQPPGGQLLSRPTALPGTAVSSASRSIEEIRIGQPVNGRRVLHRRLGDLFIAALVKRLLRM